MNKFKFVLVLFFVTMSISFMNGQNYVPNNVALEKLEVLLSQSIKSYEENQITKLERDITSQFIKIMASDLKNDNTIPVCIEAAFEKCLIIFKENTEDVIVFKDNLDNYLQE